MKEDSLFCGKNVVLGVTGGIAAYKAVQLVSNLVKKGIHVDVIMTKNATEFVCPQTFQTISKNRVCVDTFDKNYIYEVEHISLAKKADVFAVVPATANAIAKIAFGLADDMLSTTILAAKCPKIVAPAMNTGMYENPVTQRNLGMLKDLGIEIVEPESGLLACKDIGKGRLANLETIEQSILSALFQEKDLKGKKVLVTAGPTREAIDPVRFITNHSTGKMGYSIAKAAKFRGADVTLVSGPVSIAPPKGVKVINIVTAEEMLQAVTENFSQSDYIIKSAAVADYRPATIAEDKIKKMESNAVIPLEKTTDILKTLGSLKTPEQIICGFSMETKDMIKNSTNKLHSKNVDMIVANNLKVEGAGFGVDTNVVSLITKTGVDKLEKMSKEKLAHVILDRMVTLSNNKGKDKFKYLLPEEDNGDIYNDFNIKNRY